MGRLDRRSSLDRSPATELSKGRCNPWVPCNTLTMGARPWNYRIDGRYFSSRTFTRLGRPLKEDSMPGKLFKISMFTLLGLLPAVAAWADGAVYAMTNALDNNQVLVYHRGADGTLSLVQTVATGGGGSGLQLAGVDALGSAGSVQLDPDHRLLFVVNAESAAENNGAGAYNTDCRQGTITSFRVAGDGTLTFADRVFSRGLFPNSLTVRRGRGDNRGQDDKRGPLLYVLNAGGPEVSICNLT